MHDTGRARTPVQGEVPNPLNPPTGCAFQSALPACQCALLGGAAEAADIKGVRVACHAVEEGRI
jgi:peptide/nickel transport system ATP-binding protein